MEMGFTQEIQNNLPILLFNAQGANLYLELFAV